MNDMVGIANLLPEISAQSMARLDRAMAGASLIKHSPPLDELIATRDTLLALVPA
jgi:beta-N-acetylhexosaminidase